MTVCNSLRRDAAKLRRRYNQCLGRAVDALEAKDNSLAAYYFRLANETRIQRAQLQQIAEGK